MREPIELLESEPFGMGATGNFEVRYDGSAGYSIPLVVPPGRLGVQPALALTYSSRGGDGPLGVGWGLGGLSAISRCTSPAALSGQARGVLLDAEDALCIDGRRLVPVEGSTHGVDGAVYRPSRDGFERVVLHGNLTEETSWFEVQLPDGSRREYGGGEPSGNATLAGLRYSSDVDGLPDAGERVIHSWLLSRTLDPQTNYVMYSYLHRTHLSSTGRLGQEVAITEIRYTGHPSLGAGERYVRFEYTPRTQRVSSFVAGLWLVTSNELTAVATYAPGSTSPVREYRFTYSDSRHTQRRLLTSLTQCDAAGVCLYPTEFRYTEEPGGPTEVQFTEDTIGPTPAHLYDDPAACAVRAAAWPQAFFLADIDGSGTDDIVHLADKSGNCLQYEYQVSFAHLSRPGSVVFDPSVYLGITPDPVWSGGRMAAAPITAVDLDNDQRAELLDLRSDVPGDLSNPTLHLWEWDGTGVALRDNDLFGCAGGMDGHAGRLGLYGDFDGSGSSDVLSSCVASSTQLDWRLRLHDGMSHGAFQAPTDLFSGDGQTELGFIIDYDGDARSDFLRGRERGSRSARSGGV